MLRNHDCHSPKLFFLFIAGLLICPLAAHAVDLDFKLEPGASISLSAPQSQRFELGGAATFKAMAGFEGGLINLTAGITFLGLPAQTGFAQTNAGTAWAPSLGLRIQSPRESERMRLRRPHDDESFFGAKPWVDADMMYVKTGPLDRAGFAAAAGLSFPVGESRSWFLGPFVRYMQVLQGERVGFDNHDAKTIIVGLSLETGTRFVKEQPAEEEKTCVTCPPPTQVAVAGPPAKLPDRDGDGTPDEYDDCPDVKGPASNHGCPVYAKVIVKPDKLELKEKIQFAWNEATIEPVSRPALDEVAQALQDNMRFRVAIQGHASSEGGDENNQSLSSRRAEAVLEYLAHRGVSRDRLLSKGFSSSQPIRSNETESGREANRRVEFIVHFIIVKEGGVQ